MRCPSPRPPPQVLATNHVFNILVKAMGSNGDLQKIEHQTLPPRKRAGWTGGDDRGHGTSSTTPKTAKDGADAVCKLPRASAKNGGAGCASSIKSGDTNEAKRVDNDEGGTVGVSRSGETETGGEANVMPSVAVLGNGRDTGESVEKGRAPSSKGGVVSDEGGVGGGAATNAKSDVCKEEAKLPCPEGERGVEKVAVKRIAVSEGTCVSPKRVRSEIGGVP